MTGFDRRAFLAGLGQAGAALAAESWLEAIGYAQVSRPPARVRIQQPLATANFDRRFAVAAVQDFLRRRYLRGLACRVKQELNERFDDLARMPRGDAVDLLRRLRRKRRDLVKFAQARRLDIALGLPASPGPASLFPLSSSPAANPWASLRLGVTSLLPGSGRPPAGCGSHTTGVAGASRDRMAASAG